jgi:hypothetical protein
MTMACGSGRQHPLDHWLICKVLVGVNRKYVYTLVAHLGQTKP